MNYYETLLTEKGHDLETEIKVYSDKGTMHFMSLQNVCDFIMNLDRKTKDSIRKNFVMIDFKNGDVMHFVKYIAKGMCLHWEI